MQMITGNDKNLYLSSTVPSSSDFSIRTIVKGHSLNTFDVLFFDSIIAKLARLVRPSCPYRRKYTEPWYKALEGTDP